MRRPRELDPDPTGCLYVWFGIVAVCLIGFLITIIWAIIQVVQHITENGGG